ncbi:MAG: DNA primase [Gemmatimonadaceae bacterium]
MITDDTVERVRESADIVQIIGEHVNLKRAGADFRGPCPFHQGTHRNFSVSARKGMYYCFVCHESGDVFTFLQKRLGLDWPSAVRYVAAKAGVEVREVETRRDAPDAREPLWEINAAAAEFFHEQLWENEVGGQQAREYLTLRHITRDEADRFGTGFAPRDPQSMRGHLNALGFKDALILEAGVLYVREDTEELRPRFRNRLMFPIQDAVGRHVGFGGRLLGPGEPKYLNSAESSVFSKARLLYGMHLAKHSIRRDDHVIVVEGYLDVMRLVSLGIEPVVAPLGTSLTEAQASLLKRYSHNASLLYDSDRAGLKATFRAGDELLRHGFSVQVVTLPEGEDPDTFGDRFGTEGVREIMGAAMDVFERKIQELERAGYFADLRKKRQAIDRLLPTIRAASDSITRDMYLGRASEVTGISRDVLEREARAIGPESIPDPPAAPRREIRAPDAGGPRPVQPRRKAVSGEAAERELIRVMLHSRMEIDGVAERIGADDFRDPRYREIYEALVASGGERAIEEVASGLSADTSHVLQGLLAEPDAIVDARRTIEGSISALRVRELSEGMKDIDRTLPLAVGADKDELIGDKVRLLKQVQELGAVGFRHFGKSRA